MISIFEDIGALCFAAWRTGLSLKGWRGSVVHGWPRIVCFNGALFLAAGSLFLSTVSLRAGDGPSEAQVKAAFLLNFPKYVEWPATAFSQTDSPIVVAFWGEEEVADEFAVMSEKKIIAGHPIHLVRVKSIDQCQDCHILFIGSAESRKSPEMLQKLRGRSVLTVGESDDFIDHGGMIGLARRERRVMLEVNLEPIHEAGLKVSSKLLAVATVKGGKK
jgi:YfiR/HmsC-like